jgi:PAS domain S-box-containing protein
MGEPLRVLLVQSSDAAAGAVLGELEGAGLAVNSRRVESEEGMRRALDEAAWDLIIAAAELPAFSGLAALAVRNAQGLDVPFIVVSASVGAMAAVELMRAGANDVMTMEDLSRLVSSVRRELHEADVRREHRRDDEALHESEEGYRLLVESSPAPIAVHSGGIIVYANPAAARLMRAAEPAELVGKQVLDLVYPDDRPVAIERIRLTQVERRMAEPTVERFVRLDGGIVYVEQVALATTFEGRPATQIVVRDITSQVRATAAQRFLAEASARLSSSLDYRETLQTVAQLAVPDLGEWCLVDLFTDDGRFERVADATSEGGSEPSHVSTEAETARVASTQTTQVVNNVLAQGQQGFRSYVCAPLIARGRLLGAVTFGSRHPHRYDPESISVAENLASRSAMAIDNAGTFARAAADVEERTRIDAELRASRDQLETILGGIADGVLVQDVSGHFIYVNAAAALAAGFSSVEEYLSLTPTDLTSLLEVADADGRPFDPLSLPMDQVVSGDVRPDMILAFRRRDTGERRLAHTRIRLARGADGQPLAISIFRDITERIQAEERLAFLAEAGAGIGISLDEQETFEAVTQLAIHHMADWAVAYVPDDKGTTLHRTAFAHKQHPRTDLVRELEDRYPPRPSPSSVLWRVLDQGTPLLVDEITDAALMESAEDAEHLRILRELRLASALYVPIQARGRSLGVLALLTVAESGRRLGGEDLAVTQEIGRRLGLAIDNARLYVQTREAIRARDEFLSLASHELRNPVTAINGAAQLIQRARESHRLDEPTLDRYMGVIERTSAHLSRLTEDLLDVSRLQQGRMPIRFEEMDLAELVRRMVARHQLRSGDVPVSVTIESEPCLIVADLDRLEQVVTNLLENAAKYSPDGGTIDVELTEDKAGVLLAVRDRGIGVPTGATEHIFEPFGRAANASEHNIPGMGLGLYISRQIIERHGGRLWAESLGEGRGTTFRMWLPRIDSANDVRG